MTAGMSLAAHCSQRLFICTSDKRPTASSRCPPGTPNQHASLAFCVSWCGNFGFSTSACVVRVQPSKKVHAAHAVGSSRGIPAVTAVYTVARQRRRRSADSASNYYVDALQI